MLENVLRMLAIASLFVSGAACGEADYGCSHPDIVNAAKELYLTKFTGIELLKYVDDEAKPAADTLRTNYRANTNLRAIWTVEKGEHSYRCRAIVETPQLLSSCTGKDDASPACLEQERQLPAQLRRLLNGVAMAHEENSLQYIVGFTGDGGFIIHGWRLQSTVADTQPAFPD